MSMMVAVIFGVKRYKKWMVTLLSGKEKGPNGPLYYKCAYLLLMHWQTFYSFQRRTFLLATALARRKDS